MVADLLEWLASVPPAALYAVLAVVAALENIVPPLPADTVVAFGSFVAARGKGSALGSFLSTWSGNIAGAAIMYLVGRRFGAEWIERRFGKSGRGAEERFRALYGRYGLFAIFLSRFIPGVRALVPPIAGAFGIAMTKALLTMAIASGIWYGIVTYLSFRAGQSFEVLQENLKEVGLWTAVAAAALVGLGLLIWFARRRRASA